MLDLAEPNATVSLNIFILTLLPYILHHTTLGVSECEALPTAGSMDANDSSTHSTTAPGMTHALLSPCSSDKSSILS